jgi:hypothetical protein
MKTIHRISNSRVGSSVGDDWRYVVRFIFRPSNALLIVTLTFGIGFVFGVFSKKSIPQSIVSSPLAAIKVMNAYPVGSSVLPKNTPQAKEQFEPFGWWQEPGVVVGYDSITYKQKVITLCQIRTHQGQGHILTVNPSWLDAKASSRDR